MRWEKWSRNKPSSTERTTKHQRITTPLLKWVNCWLYLRQWFIKVYILITKSGKFPSLIGSVNHKGTCLTSSSSMSLGGFSENCSFLAILWNTSETSSMFLFQLLLFLFSVFSTLSPFYFYNCKTKFHFFIFNMFSYFLWNFEHFGFFSYNNTFFCNFLKQFFGFINSYFSVFYISSLINQAYMAISPLISSIIYNFKILIFSSSFLPQACLPILLWFV